MEAMYQEYKDIAEFRMIYIREAHAADGARPTQIAKSKGITQQKNYTDRCTTAQMLFDDQRLTIPCLVDSMDNATNTAYSAEPDRVFLVNVDGTLAVAGERGPRGFKPGMDAAEQWLIEFKKSREESARKDRGRSKPKALDSDSPDLKTPDSRTPDAKASEDGVSRRSNAGDRAAPTQSNVSYGTHPAQAYDIWLAESKNGEPTPLVIYIHGGGFRGGDKRSASGQPIQNYLTQGISFASMNYRLSDVGPYPLMMHDCARGLQHIRSQAKEWNLNPDRVACYGGSAGAGISLWLGFHSDLADLNSDDPVARQSTRIVAAGATSGQSTYDLRTFRQWFDVPNLKPDQALLPFYAIENERDWESDRVKNLMQDASPISHLTKDDPPVFMTYPRGDIPIDERSLSSLWVHHARLGLKLKEAMDALDLECHVTWRANPSREYQNIHAFLQEKVQENGPN